MGYSVLKFAISLLRKCRLNVTSICRHTVYCTARLAIAVHSFFFIIYTFLNKIPKKAHFKLVDTFISNIIFTTIKNESSISIDLYFASSNNAQTHSNVFEKNLK